MKPEDQKSENQPSYYEMRLRYGEAYMFCEDCGVKLYSFDGNKDASRNACPYERYGKCEPPRSNL